MNQCRVRGVDHVVSYEIVSPSQTCLCTYTAQIRRSQRKYSNMDRHSTEMLGIAKTKDTVTHVLEASVNIS